MTERIAGDRRLYAAHTSMRAAAETLHLADLQLQTARKDYAASNLPADIKQARMAALDAKIAAVRDLRTDPVMHPWADDPGMTRPAHRTATHDDEGTGR